MPDGAPTDPFPSCESKAGAILTQARCAFVEKGFNGASMQDLARAAGMCAGNFYRYFPSKAAIVEALIARDLAEIEAHFQSVVASPDPVGALKAALRERLVEKCKSDDTLWAEIAATAMRRPEVAAIHNRIEDTIARRVAEVIAVAGGVPASEAEARFGVHARMTYIIMHGALSSNLGRAPNNDALHDLLIRTVEQVIDDALVHAKDD